MSNKKDERIDDYTDEDVVEEVVETTEIPKQRDFYKIPRRFGSVPVDEIPEAESGLLEYIRTRHGELLENIKTSGDLPEDGLKDAVVAFVKTITKGDDS